MGSGFTRRYNYAPGSNVLTQIEGIILLDLPPPGSIQGVATGVVCLIAEFQDSTYGLAVDANGNVTQAPNPVEIFSGQDLLTKVGGFDPTIGDFGNSMGNGFVELRNKSFAQLVVLPVSLASAKATRQYRKLPWCTSAVNPMPFVPMQAASVPAGTPFVSGSAQVNSAGPVAFTGLLAYAQGIDGIVTASTGPTETFASPGSLFYNAAGAVPAGGIPVTLGDAIVLGAPLTTAILGSPTGGLAVGAQDTTLFLAAPGWTGYPASGLLQVDQEQMTYAGVTSSGTGPSFYGVTRGVNGTVGATHNAGAVVAGINNVDTYRVASIPGATSVLSLEQQSGQNFTATRSFGASAQPWRLHHASDADSGVGINANAGSYTVPARPLTAGVSAAQVLPPQSSAPAQTFNQWNPLSGLAMQTDPVTGLAFNAAVQGINPPASASLDALYSNCITAMLSQNLPEATVTILWAARKSANIRSGLRASVDGESAIGVGRVAVVAPDLQSVTSTTQAVAATDPGVGGNRDERLIYSWPAVQTYVPEAVNFNIKGSDGKFYQNGIIDMPADGWLAAVLSNINPEWNPGQAGAPVPAVLAQVSGLARNMPNSLMITDYTVMKQQGICGIRIDRSVGPVFQSGVTTSLTPGQTTIQRRRMADFIEDSIAEATAPLAKLPLTELFKDNVVTECDDFLGTLLSADNPAQQRINAYYVDAESGNTQALNDAGVFVVIVGVRLTPTADYIVYQFNVGNNVVVPTQVA